MNTKTCPRCGNQVVTAAVICLGCGYQLDRPPPNKSRTSSRDKAWGAISILLVLAVGTCAVVEIARVPDSGTLTMYAFACPNEEKLPMANDAMKSWMRIRGVQTIKEISGLYGCTLQEPGTKFTRVKWTNTNTTIVDINGKQYWMYVANLRGEHH